MNYFVNKTWVAAWALLCSVLWGSAFPVLKISYAEMHIAANDISAIIVLAGMRFFLAALLLFALVGLGSGTSLRISTKKALELLVLGIMQISLQYFFFYNGLAHTTGMKGSVLQSFGTFATVLLAHFVYADDKINGRKGIGLMTGLAGIVLVHSGKSFDFDFSWNGEGFLLISGLVTALAMLFAKRLAQTIHPFVVTGWQMFFGSILLIGAGLPGLEEQSMVFTARGWLLLLYSAFLSAAAFSLWYSLLKYNKAGEISVYRFMVPVSGAILSVLFLPGETFTLSALGALVLVAAGIVIVNYNKT